MARLGRVAGVGVLGLAAFALLALLVLRPWWGEWAPEIAQLPLGMLSLALGVSLVLWLQRGPRLGGSLARRRPRLRNRVARATETDGTKPD